MLESKERNRDDGRDVCLSTGRSPGVRRDADGRVNMKWAEHTLCTERAWFHTWDSL